MGTLYEIVRADDVEASELRKLSIRAERNMLRQAVEKAERRAWEAEREVARQKKAHEKEKDGIVAFFGAFSGLAVMFTCVLAAPWWTAICPAIGTVMIMRKAGWI